jgi:hypothetical protein
MSWNFGRNMAFIMKLFTFIATSESLGDIILQTEGEEMKLAWISWAPKVAAEIVERLDVVSVWDTESIAIQIKNEGPIIKTNEIGVWLGDLLIDELEEEVIQVLVVDTRREDY